MRTRILAGFDSSVFCIPVCINNTSLVGTMFPRIPWQHQFPVATVLLQYFLAICIFFFYLYVKNTCRGEGKLDRCSAYFTEHHFLWKDLVCFPVFWMYSGLWIRQQTGEKALIFLLQFWRWPFFCNIKVGYSFDAHLSRIFPGPLYLQQHYSSFSSVSHWSAQPRLPCCVFMFSLCSDLYFRERLEEAVLGAAPSHHFKPEVFKAAHNVSLFPATWLKFFSLILSSHVWRLLGGNRLFVLYVNCDYWCLEWFSA